MKQDTYKAQDGAPKPGGFRADNDDAQSPMFKRPEKMGYPVP
jgi:hypothetical protein